MILNVGISKNGRLVVFWYNRLMIQWEFRESCALNRWLEGVQVFHPELRGFHVPNENPGRNKAERAKMGYLRRMMGVKSGVCDWFFFCPPNIYIAVELKKPERAGKSYATKNEKDWIGFFAECGFSTFVARGAAEAADFVEQTLKERGVDVNSTPFDGCPF